jgi:hypothetical protein
MATKNGARENERGDRIGQARRIGQPNDRSGSRDGSRTAREMVAEDMTLYNKTTQTKPIDPVFEL